MLARQRSQGANEIDWMDVRKRMMRSSASNPLHKLSPGARHILVTWIEDQAKRRLKAKQMRALDRRLARKHLQLFLLGLLGVLLMIYDEEKRWDKGEQYEYGMENLAPLVGSSWTDLVIPACNILLVWRMGDLYRELAEKKRRKWHLQSRWDAFWNSSLKWKFSLEVAICIVQPPPWIVYTVEFPGDSWVRHIGLFMFMRVYMVARILKDTSLVRCAARPFLAVPDVDTTVLCYHGRRRYRAGVPDEAQGISNWSAYFLIVGVLHDAPRRAQAAPPCSCSHSNYCNRANLYVCNIRH